MTKSRIEKFTNLLGETRYRFVVPSILHKGEEARSLRSWATRKGARQASVRNSARESIDIIGRVRVS